MKKIQKIVIHYTPDYDADTSWLGTFDDKALSALAINYHEKSGESSRTFEWFNPQPGTCETIKHAEDAYNRMITLNEGRWCFMSIKAVAHIATSLDGKSWINNTIESGGVYGIESDSDKASTDEISCDQQNDILATLHELGFSVDEIEAAPMEEKREA